jgi:hypothetical protein
MMWQGTGGGTTRLVRRWDIIRLWHYSTSAPMGHHTSVSGHLTRSKPLSLAVLRVC